MRGIEIRGLGFSFPRGPNVIDHLDAEFRSEAVTVLTGPSGRGKSTLLYLIGLMHRQQFGEVMLDGRPTASLGDRERSWIRAHRFGFVFQDAALDPSRSVLDNVLETSIYRGAVRTAEIRRANALMEEFGVEARATHRPGQISGGQAQRVALCRALLNEPHYILADEPTGNLDAESSDVVLSALGARAQAGACVIVATHDPVVVDAADARVDLGEAP